MTETLLEAIQLVFSRPDVLGFTLGGVVLGIMLGILPGIGSVMAMAVLLPLTFGLDSITAVAFLIAVYSASTYGGSVSAILLGIPGTAQSITTQLEGYPMMKAGRGGEALTFAIFGSAVGGFIGLGLLVLFAPIIARLAFNLQSTEYAALTILALTLMAFVSPGAMTKGIISGAFGLLLATIGMDAMTFTPRLDLGIRQLRSGIEIIPVIVGIFGMAEVLRGLGQLGADAAVNHSLAKIRRLLPEWSELKKTIPASLRGGLIGTFIGALPAVGAPVAVVISYAQEQRLSRNPERFGKGAPEGIVGPESCNNASVGGALIPMMTLGIPGNPVTAVLLGALLVHGLTPGPRLFRDHALFVSSTFVSLGLAIILTTVIALAAARYFALIVKLPNRLLLPMIGVLAVVGSFAVNNSFFDVWVMLVFGVVGYAMGLAGIPAAPLVFGLVLGPILETNLRRALMVSEGDPTVFVTRPISLGLILIAVTVLVWPFISARLKGSR
jgi:putative tricarboxylic transport membrane protein